MSELTNIHARSVKDLTTPNEMPADPNAFDQVKLVAGNFPPKYAGNEAMTVGMLKELAAQGREEEIEEIIQRLNDEEKRAIEADFLLNKNKADKEYVDKELGLKAPQAKTYTKTEVDTALASYVGGRKAYTTLALAQAEQALLPVNTAIEVTNDPVPTNNGTYQWNGTTLTKSAYDPLTQAKGYTDNTLADGYVKNYTTEALLLAAKPVVAAMNARAEDTRKIYRWTRTSAEGVTPVAGTWVDTGLSDLDQAKRYTAERTEGLKQSVAQKLYVNLDEDLHQFADVEGNIVARIDQDGMFHVIGLENPIQLQFTEQKNEILGTVDSVANMVQRSLNVLTDQSDLHTFTDADGYIVAKISHDGQLHVVGLNQPVQVEFVTLNKKVDAVSESINRVNYGVDDLYLVTDLEGNIVARIKEDGRYYIVGLSNDIATEFESVRDEINRKSESIKDTSIAENRSYKDTFTPQVQTVLNTLMYAQTGAKAPAPLHYFPQNYTISKTWINNINQFGHANSTRLEINSPYRDDDGFVHPHILEFYNGFRGYRYIAAINPYYLTNEAEENPCIYGSNDLINFDLLDGFDQPLDVRPIPEFSTGHNSDNVLAYDPRTGELICIWRQTLRNPNNDGVRIDALWMRKTKDGYNWTARERIFKNTDHALAGGAGSPAIVYNIADGYWYMYLTTLSLTNDAMRLFRAKHLKEDKWEYVSTLTLPFKPWHQDVKIVGNKVCMLVYCYPPDNTIYFGISDDFINFEWTQNLLLENNAYKSSFVPEFNDQNQMALKILYSTDASPSEVSEKWRMYMHQTNFMNVSLELR